MDVIEDQEVSYFFLKFLNFFRGHKMGFPPKNINFYLLQCFVYTLDWVYRPLTQSDPGFQIMVITRGGFNLRALDCRLTLKLCLCFHIYKLTSHEKKISLNLKKSVRFWDLKILWIWDFATPWLTKMTATRLIFEIEGSYFGFFIIFMCLKKIIFSNLVSMTNFQIFSFFYYPPQRGVG